MKLSKEMKLFDLEYDLLWLLIWSTICYGLNIIYIICLYNGRVLSESSLGPSEGSKGSSHRTAHRPVVD